MTGSRGQDSKSGFPFQSWLITFWYNLFDDLWNAVAAEHLFTMAAGPVAAAGDGGKDYRSERILTT
jgi:hypothetical protein